MKKIGKKIIIVMSVLTYLSTVQAMAMVMPAGFQGSHCEDSHYITMDRQVENSLPSKSSANQDQTHESSHDTHHCMACFAISDDEVNYLSGFQPAADLHSIIQEFCSVALNILSPPPKRRPS